MFNGSLCSVWEFPWGSDGLSDAYSCREREKAFDSRLCRNCLHGDGERRQGAASSQRLPQDAQLLGSLCLAKGLLPFTAPHSPGMLSDCPWLMAFPARCCQSIHFADLTVGNLCLITSFAFPLCSEM